MSENERDLIEIIDTLCDAVCDSPCGCGCCPYVYTIVDEQCEVYDVISKVKRGGVMTLEGIAMLIASLLLFIVGIKLGEERAKGEEEIE